MISRRVGVGKVRIEDVGMASQEKSVNSVVYTIFTFVLPSIDNFVSWLCLHEKGPSVQLSVFPLFPLVLEERALRLSGADHRGRRCGFPPGQGRCDCRDPGSLLGFGRADRDLAFRRRCVRPILGRPHDSGRGTRSDCKRRDRRLIGFRGGSGGIIWKAVPFEAVQGVTEDTGYDSTHDPAKPRNL